MILKMWYTTSAEGLVGHYLSVESNFRFGRLMEKGSLCAMQVELFDLSQDSDECDTSIIHVENARNCSELEGQLYALHLPCQHR